MNYEIKITGSGTLREIRNALKVLVEDIECAIPELSVPRVTWEDKTLLTEISEEE
jgi:hypothetical protein